MTYAYHWSPSTNRSSILKRGLLVPKDHTRLTTPVTCSEGHRNPHISLGRTPAHAWELSGGFLIQRAAEQGESHSVEIPLKWDLWQADIGPVRAWRNDDHEYTSGDIPARWVLWVAERWVVDG